MSAPYDWQARSDFATTAPDRQEARLAGVLLWILGRGYDGPRDLDGLRDAAEAEHREHFNDKALHWLPDVQRTLDRLALLGLVHRDGVNYYLGATAKSPARRWLGPDHGEAVLPGA